MQRHAPPTKLYHIQVAPPIRQIYRRLGLKNKTVVSAREREKIGQTVHEGMLACHLVGVYQRLPLERRSEDKIVLPDGIVWKSRKLRHFLQEAQEVFLVAATTGPDIVALRDQRMREGRHADAVVLDALGSEIVEAAVDWLHDYLRKLLRKELKAVSARRYSPGYGDFSLDHQQGIFALLQLESLGLSLNDRYLLTPEKSVTAVIAIR